MRFLCESCQTMLETPADQAGQPMKCESCDTYFIVPKGRFAPGTVIGDYVIRRELGHGAMGTVYLARQLSLERQVALKVLHPVFSRNEAFIENFVREARTAANLNHPAIVQCYAVGVEDDTYFLAMEYVSGKSLANLLDDRWRLATTQALEIVRQVAIALQYAWRQQRLVHRDIKPENIMLTEDGTVKLADLGIARPVHELHLEDQDQILGTPQYLSPEYVIGQPLDFRSDIYSLGAVLYQCVTGHLPFTGETGEEIARKQVNEYPKPPKTFNVDLPDEVCRVIDTMLAKAPDRRYQDQSVLISELGKLLAQLQSGGDRSMVVLGGEAQRSPGETSLGLGAGAAVVAPAPSSGGTRLAPTGTTVESRAGGRPRAARRAYRVRVAATAAVIALSAAAVAGLAWSKLGHGNAAVAPVNGAGAGAGMERPADMTRVALGDATTPVVLAATSGKPAVGGEGVRIVAVLADPDGPDLGFEQVRLSNAGAGVVMLAGWKLVDKAGGEQNLSGEIAAGGMVVVTLGNTLRLNNDAESLVLRNAAGLAVHDVHYEKGDVKSGKWLEFPATP